MLTFSSSKPTEHPRGDSCHSLRVGSDGSDVIEDVDKYEEEGDEERHPAGDNFRGDEEAHPGGDHEQGWGEVVDKPSLNSNWLLFL